jgi:hypothetical protein
MNYAAPESPCGEQPIFDRQLTAESGSLTLLHNHD